jgi:dienelactone hydrolase
VKRLFSIYLLGLALTANCAPGAVKAEPRPVSWDTNVLFAAPAWIRIDQPKSAGLQAITYDGLRYHGRTNRVFAWLGVPPLKPGEKAPAMVLVHGGGGTAFEAWVRLWVERGYAAIAMDTCGQVPVGSYGKWIRDELGGPPGWGGFDQLNLPAEEQWTYHAVADAILAHSLIRSLPEVDPNKTGVTGISWGGYLTCIIAGIDTRFKLAVPVYGCGFYRDTVFGKDLENLGPELADKWMSWWDPSVYLENATLPILWVNGSNDFAYTLNAWQASYRLPKGPRWLCARLRMPHAHGGAGENPREIHAIADNILKAGPPLPRITEIERNGTNVGIQFTCTTPIAKAEFNYTRDAGRWQDRKWDSIPAQLDGNRAMASLPSACRVWYFNLFDDHDCVVSSEHVEIQPATQESTK